MKISADRTNIVIVIVNLDPHVPQEDTLELPLGEFGLAGDAAFSLEEAFSQRVVRCHGAYQRFHLDPETHPSQIFRLQKP